MVIPLKLIVHYYSEDFGIFNPLYNIVTYYNRVRLGVRIVKEINKHLFTLSWLNKINQKELYERVKVASRG